MKLGKERAAVVHSDDRVTEIPGYRDAGQLLRYPHWETAVAQGGGAQHALHKKSWENRITFRPVVTLRDNIDHPEAVIRRSVNGQEVQNANISDLLFGVEELMTYVSALTTLHPGDTIATGTPSNVGFSRDPQQFLRKVDEVVTSIDGIGELRGIARVIGKRCE